MYRLSILFLLSGSMFGAQWVAFDQYKPEGSPLKVEVHSASPAGITIHVSISGMWVEDTTVDGITFQRISIPGTHATLNRIGQPELPQIARHYALPPSSGTVVSEANATIQILIDYLVFPEQHAGSTEFEINPVVYGENFFSPTNAESVGEPGVMRNVRMGKVSFCHFNTIPLNVS